MPDDKPLNKSLPRFFVQPNLVDKVASTITISDRQQVSQIKRVLRLAKGDWLLVLDGQGNLYKCLIKDMNDKEVKVHIEDSQVASGEPPIDISVCLPLLKGGRFEWALQKLTELGVKEIIPLTSQRSVVKVKDADKPDKADKVNRWQMIAKEAAEQCERSIVPKISKPRDLEELLAPSAVSQATQLKVLCAERSEEVLLSELINAKKISNTWPRNILIVIGPEGGFTDAEIAKASQAGFQLVSLGDRILRSETAAIYALAQVVTILVTPK